MAAPLQLLRAPRPAVVPFLCRGKIWLPFRRDQTRIYKGPPIILDPLRNKKKKDIPLFFGRHKLRHPVEQAAGSLSWAGPIFAAYKRKLEAEEDRKESVTVHKLHAVQREKKTLYGIHKRYKKIMKALGLHPDQVPAGQFVIVKNTEENNEYLTEVKHLVRIKPVTFPHGEPDDQTDPRDIHMTENAEVIVRHKLHALNVVDTRPEDKWAMEKDTIVRGNRKRIMEHRVSLEYFPPQYVYRFNQDGKEHRYTHNLPKQSEQS